MKQLHVLLIKFVFEKPVVCIESSNNNLKMFDLLYPISPVLESYFLLKNIPPISFASNEILSPNEGSPPFVNILLKKKHYPKMNLEVRLLFVYYPHPFWIMLTRVCVQVWILKYLNICAKHTLFSFLQKFKNFNQISHVCIYNLNPKYNFLLRNLKCSGNLLYG